MFKITVINLAVIFLCKKTVQWQLNNDCETKIFVF